MSRVLRVVIACVVIGGCGDDAEATGQDDQPCETIAETACVGEVTHLCRSQDVRQLWEARENCAESTTANCSCAVFVDGRRPIAQCTVDGENGTDAVGCDGEMLQE